MDLNLDMWAQGFAAILQPQNGLFLLLGTCVGMVVGVLPAIGPNFGVALMLPLTFGMPPETAIIFLASVHAATAYGDSIASILINVPGGGGSVAACWDGHPMARQGKGGMALAISAFGSWAGGIGGWVAMVILSPVLIAFAARIGPPEVFMIALLALSLLAVAAKGQNSKGLIMACFGLLVSFVGQDEITGAIRFTFGSEFLENGIDLIPVVVGVFAISQLLIMAEEGGSIAQIHSAVGGTLQALKEIVKRWRTVIRAELIGVWIGVLPALGIGSASVMSYLTEKAADPDPDSFGKGNPSGLLAPEIAKGACVVGDLIPTFTLGIPGSPTTAILMAALIVHGLRPGPEFFSGTLPYIVYAGILLAQFSFFIIGIFTARYWARLIMFPNAILLPIIAVMALIGSYADSNKIESMFVLLFFGVVGYIMERNEYPAAALVLGVVLGNLAESNFNRSMVLFDGSLAWVWQRPIALVLLLCTILSLAMPYFGDLKALLFRLARRQPGGA
jgi:putative tricarboxylic transport membrane protein